MVIGDSLLTHYSRTTRSLLAHYSLSIHSLPAPSSLTPSARSLIRSLCAALVRTRGLAFLGHGPLLLHCWVLTTDRSLLPSLNEAVAA